MAPAAHSPWPLQPDQSPQRHVSRHVRERVPQLPHPSVWTCPGVHCVFGDPTHWPSMHPSSDVQRSPSLHPVPFGTSLQPVSSRVGSQSWQVFPGRGPDAATHAASMTHDVAAMSWAQAYPSGPSASQRSLVQARPSPQSAGGPATQSPAWHWSPTVQPVPSASHAVASGRAVHAVAVAAASQR